MAGGVHGNAVEDVGGAGVEDVGQEAGAVNGGPRILDPELQKLIDTVIETQDDDVTEKTCKAIEQYVYDNVAYVGIASGIYTVLAKPNMTGFALPSDGGICDVAYVMPLN